MDILYSYTIVDILILMDILYIVSLIITDISLIDIV